MPRPTSRAAFLLTVLALALPALAAAAPPVAPPANVVPRRDLMERIAAAWSTMNLDTVAPYYDKSGVDVFYDVATTKYVSWTAYAAGVREDFSRLRSVRYTVGDDVAVHVGTGVAWGTTTLHVTSVDRSGGQRTSHLRWTAIWELRAGRWAITHEHRSSVASR